MGKYLDALNNFSVTPYNFSYNFQDDIVTDAITKTNQVSNNLFGTGIVAFLWFAIFTHLINKSNGFGLTRLHCFISTNTIMLSISLMFLYLGILTSSQVFIWLVLIYFLCQTWAIMRTTN